MKTKVKEVKTSKNQNKEPNKKLGSTKHLSKNEKLSECDIAKNNLILDIEKRYENGILEKTNAELLIKLIKNADDINEAVNISALGTTYKRTGFHFDKRLEKIGKNIKHFKFNKKLSFLQKDGKPHHKLIIGDNYYALQNLLIEYRGKIDAIYIDPPYGKDSMGEFAKTNYENNITRDNLLSMLYNRLVLARDLLSDEGVIFCSIDDRNQAYVKCLFDEVFGEENFCNTVFVLDNLKGKTNDNYITSVGSKLLVYVNKKTINNEIGFNEIENIYGDVIENKYKMEDDIGFYNPITFKKTGQSKYREDRPYMYFPILQKDDRLYAIDDEEYEKIYDKNNKKFNDDYIEQLKIKYKQFNFILPLSSDGEKLRWTSSFNTFKQKMNEDIYFDNDVKQKNRPDPQELLQIYASGTPKSFMYKPSYANGTDDLKSVMDKIEIDFPKPIEFIKDLIKLIKNKNCVVLDFFAGSGTTGQAVLELNKEDGGNRQFILCQLNEKTDNTPNGIAVDVTSKRLKRVMTGKCYDGKDDFKWIKENEALGGSLDVYDIIETPACISNDKNPFDEIDETLYGVEKFRNINDKIKWVCQKFSNARKFEIIKKE